MITIRSLTTIEPPPPEDEGFSERSHFWIGRAAGVGSAVEAGRVVADAFTSADGRAQPVILGTLTPEQVFELPPPAHEDRDSARIREATLTGAADLGAGMIGSTADYLAESLSELFAPTPPDVREARARAAEEAKERAEAAKPVNPYSPPLPNT